MSAWVYVCLYVYRYIDIDIYVCVCVYVSIYVCDYVYINMCMHVSMSIYTCVCLYVCIEVNSFVTLGEQGGEGLFMSAWVGGRSCPLIGLGRQRASPIGHRTAALLFPSSG